VPISRSNFTKKNVSHPAQTVVKRPSTRKIDRTTRTYSDFDTAFSVSLRRIVSYTPTGHLSGPVGSFLEFLFDLFFATQPALTRDFIAVPEPFVFPFAGDVGTPPVLPFRLVLGRRRSRVVERNGVVGRRVVVGRRIVVGIKGLASRKCRG
jgi:hypothetical protein